MSGGQQQPDDPGRSLALAPLSDATVVLLVGDREPSSMLTASRRLSAMTAEDEGSVVLLSAQVPRRLEFEPVPVEVRVGVELIQPLVVWLRGEDGAVLQAAHDQMHVTVAAVDLATNAMIYLSGVTTVFSMQGKAVFEEIRLWGKPVEEFAFMATALGLAPARSTESSLLAGPAAKLSVPLAPVEFHVPPRPLEQPPTVTIVDAKRNLVASNYWTTVSVTLEELPHPGGVWTEAPPGVLAGLSAVRAVAGKAIFTNLSIHKWQAHATAYTSPVSLRLVFSAYGLPPSSRALALFACSEGQYYDLQGAKCLGCPDNTISSAGSDNISACICNHGFTGRDCTQCTAGKFKDFSGSGACTMCSPGKFSTKVGASSNESCTTCPENSVSEAGSDSLFDCKCEKGYTGKDGEECMVCPTGSSKVVRGSSACIPCAVGKYANETGHPEECLSCPAHTYSAEGSSLITNCTCNAGYTGPDGDACEACVAGKYKDAAGEAGCSDCPASSSSPEGSTASTNCTCNAGYTGPDGDTCEACPTGSSKVVRGSSACIPCAAGKYANETGHPEECLSCPAHTYSAEGSSLITNCTCNAGYTGADGDACEACVAGKYKGIIGTSACFLCPVGKYSTGAGAASEVVCVACPNNTTSGEGSSNIANCTNTSTAAPTPPLTTPPP